MPLGTAVCIWRVSLGTRRCVTPHAVQSSGSSCARADASLPPFACSWFHTSTAKDTALIFRGQTIPGLLRKTLAYMRCFNSLATRTTVVVPRAEAEMKRRRRKRRKRRRRTNDTVGLLASRRQGRRLRPLHRRRDCLPNQKNAPAGIETRTLTAMAWVEALGCGLRHSGERCGSRNGARMSRIGQKN